MMRPWAPAARALRAEVPQVHGVGEAVGGHQQGGLGQLWQAVQQILLRTVDIGPPPGHNPLVVRGAADAVQGGPLLDPEADAGGPGQAPHLLEPRPPDPLGHDNFFQGGIGAAQGGQHRMAAVNDVSHRLSQVAPASGR